MPQEWQANSLNQDPINGLRSESALAALAYSRASGPSHDSVRLSSTNPSPATFFFLGAASDLAATHLWAFCPEASGQVVWQIGWLKACYAPVSSWLLARWCSGSGGARFFYSYAYPEPEGSDYLSSQRRHLVHRCRIHPAV